LIRSVRAERPAEDHVANPASTETDAKSAFFIRAFFSMSLQHIAACTATALTSGYGSLYASAKANSVFRPEPFTKCPECWQELGVFEQARCLYSPVTMEVTFQLAQYCRRNAGVPTACKAYECLTPYFRIRLSKAFMKCYPKGRRV
jgi:hypothetical protein